MFARNLLAMIAMLPWSAVSCLAASGSPAVDFQSHEVGVYLRTDGGLSPSVFDSVKTEMEKVLSQGGFHLKWWGKNSAQASPIEAEELIVVDLRGSCAVPQKRTLRQVTTLQLELASTYVVGSEVLPFTTLDCSTFNDLTTAPLLRIEASRRDSVYGRALARVLAHEFYHVLVHTQKHTAKGVAKKAHSAEDLLSDRFDFDSVALGLLRQTHPDLSTTKKGTGPEGVVEAPAEPVVALTGPAENPPGRQ